MSNHNSKGVQEFMAESRARARQLDTPELERHAQLGRVCGCKDCFCCAALEVYRKRKRLKNTVRVEDERHPGVTSLPR